MTIFIRSPYNYDTNEASNQTALAEFDESKTHQHFKDECDINRIVAQYQRGQTPVAPNKVPLGEDFVAITDYHTAMQAVRKGQEAFNQMPASVRAQFNNNPELFVDFVINPDNIESVREMGLAPAGVPQNSPPPEAVQ